MIQFNLLPDLKLQFIKAKRVKRTVLVISFLVAASFLAIFIFLFLTVHVFQKEHINNLTEDIKQSQSKLEENVDLNKVLTIQNQLNSLPELHDAKPVTSRLFTYVSKVTPSAVSIGSISLDYNESSLTFSGNADSLSTINKFVDTLKFTTYQVIGEDKTTVSSGTKPFSEVVLDSFSKSEDQATYSISFKFDPVIFDSTKNVEFVVPKIISTRSETEKPDELFKALPEPGIRAQ